MKKILLLATLSIILPNIAWGACEEGEEFTGKNGHVYCKSNQYMNWWSAFAWCKANGRHLVTLDEACNNNSWINGCPNIFLDVDQFGWTSIASGDQHAYRVHFKYATVSTAGRAGEYCTALCY